MSVPAPNPENRIALFQRKEVRRTIHNNEWWFVVVDVVAALTDAADPTDYLNKIRRRDPELAKGYGQIVHPLSIPSVKAEPFKRWLARVGYERIQEIEDPELATKRTRALYQAKGYSDEWIEKRMRSIAIRDELTGEWKKRGVKEQREYAILTAEISKATFGLTPGQYAEFKRLKRENVRDHMSDLELIFSMLGEASTTEIARTKDARGFPKTSKLRAKAERSRATPGASSNARADAKSSRERISSRWRNPLRKRSVCKIGRVRNPDPMRRAHDSEKYDLSETEKRDLIKLIEQGKLAKDAAERFSSLRQEQIALGDFLRDGVYLGQFVRIQNASLPQVN